jgi:hypothetical protein
MLFYFQDIERRLQEKEEEFENTRKNFQRALDSMQVNIVCQKMLLLLIYHSHKLEVCYSKRFTKITIF